MESLDGMLKSNPAGDSLILLVDFNGKIMGSDSLTLKDVSEGNVSSWML